MLNLIVLPLELIIQLPNHLSYPGKFTLPEGIIVRAIRTTTIIALSVFH